MLKETFKMRKIGKHLVNVSMLSLAIAPVVVSGVQPVFAEERVANAENVPSNLFKGRTVANELKIQSRVVTNQIPMEPITVRLKVCGLCLFRGVRIIL